jgi:hypothetical protein
MQRHSGGADAQPDRSQAHSHVRPCDPAGLEPCSASLASICLSITELILSTSPSATAPSYARPSSVCTVPVQRRPRAPAHPQNQAISRLAGQTMSCAGAVVRPALPGRPAACPGGPIAEDGDDAAAEDWTRARSTAHPRNRKFAAVRDTPAAGAWIRGHLARGATRQAGR